MSGLRFPIRTVLVVVVLVFATHWLQASAEGSDLEFGGPGAEPGKFAELRDLAFDDQGNLHTLEGVRWDEQLKAVVGNGRVQKFDPAGKPLLQFSVVEQGRKEQDPFRLAVDKLGNIYVTQPLIDQVSVFAPDGKPLRQLKIPHASAVTRWRTSTGDRIAVLPCDRKNVDGQWAWLGGGQIIPIETDGAVREPIKLERALTGVVDLTAGPGGDFYVIADVNQLYKFNSEGKLLAMVGAGENSRANDGSELLHSVAVDSKGFIHTEAWGNPSLIVRFSPDLREIRRREAQFKWADSWGPHGNYVPLAVDNHDRLWACATHVQDPKGPNFSVYRPVPAVIRAESGYFDEGKRGVLVSDTRGIGFKPKIVVDLPSGVAYERGRIPISVVVEKALRQIKDVTVTWRVVDMYRTELTHGEFTMPLRDGEDERHPLEFSASALGWYMVQCDFTSQGVLLASIARFFGVTRRYPSMVELGAEGTGGATDPLRTAFSGLMNQRLHAVNSKERLEQLEKEIALCEKAGVTWFVQLSDKRDCEPENVRAVVERFKGRVNVWEVMNEPNFTFSPADYVKVLKEASRIIKEIDSAALVMGPDVCGIDLAWYEEFYKEGGGAAVDILSVHDYEGHETIDSEHWRWKVGALRRLMARHGDGGKPIWQTERAIAGVRGDNWLGGTQAVRMSLHRDLLETLGVRPAHNNHFYTNDHGFGDCPSWIWSGSGPHPAVFALRVRHAMTIGKTYQGTLDFGPTAERLLLGVRYSGDDGSTIMVRNLGSLDIPLDFDVIGSGEIEVVDAFGNVGKAPISNGKFRVTARQMPTYLRLAKGQEVTPARFDLGRNYASHVVFTCSAPGASAGSLLNNGIYETINSGNPHGGTDGKAIWCADMAKRPVMLEMAFPQPLPINAVLINGLHADNTICALQDYDLQWFDNGTWRAIEEVRVACPASEPCVTAGSVANLWSLDYNVFLHRFKAITTDRLRLVARRVTNGFVPDEKARAWGTIIPQKLMLREVEIYGPQATCRADAVVEKPERRGSFDRAKMTVTATNSGTSAVSATATIIPPVGWGAAPAEFPLRVEAKGEASASVVLTPPPVVPAGRAFIDARLVDSSGKHLDLAWATMDIAAPVIATPLPPPEIASAAQPLVVEVRNPGEEPASGVARMVLNGPREVAPVEQPFGPITPGKTARVEVRVPGLELVGKPWRAVWTIVVDHVSVTACQDLTIKAWSVLGPFPPEFDKDFGPEAKVDLKAVVKEQAGNELRWRTALMDANGFLDLTKLFEKHDNVCAYVVAYVRAPEARQALVSFGSDDGGKLWVNGEKAHAENGAHGATPGQFKMPIKLRAGWNEVLFKIMQGNGGWGLYCAIVASVGAPIGDAVWAPCIP